MSQEKYIAAIEISSSKISGAVGIYTPTGHLNVIAVEQEHAVECVSYGIIKNVEEVANRITNIITRLEHRTGVSPRKISKVYVGLAGRSLRNVPREVSRSLPEDTEITEDIMRKMADEALRSHIDASLEVIEALPASYIVNKSETTSPIGMFGNSLKAQYQLITARPTLRKHIQRVLEKVDLQLAGLVVTPVAVGSMVLSEDERRLGCMLVDMGAETTTVSIYQNGSLHYLSVLPMGSRNITRDITSLSVLEKDAEAVKTNSGNAMPADNTANMVINGLRMSDVSTLVCARSEEIIANIIEQITYAGISAQQLSAGIVIVGGGFNLNRMGELLHRQSDLKVRRASLPGYVKLEDTKAPSYESIELISILNAGTAASAPECLELKATTEYPSDNDYEYTDDQPDPTEEYEHTSSTSRGSGVWTSRLDKIKKALAGLVSSSDDDDDTLLEED